MPHNLAEVPCRDSEKELVRLMAAYGTSVKRLCRCLLNDPTLAEDAAQEVFIKAWRSLDSFRGESSERTWLMRIAVNTCRSMQRAAWFRRVDRRVTPEELPLVAEEAQADATVWNAVQALPRDLKQAVVLRYYEDISLKEAAEALGIGINTLSSRLRRARKRLEKELEGWYFDEAD